MSDGDRGEITRLIEATDGGSAEASGHLLEAVYSNLRRLAQSRLAKEPPGQTVQATDLVHEAYLRLAGGDCSWEGKGHFYGAAAEAIRRILIERARHKASRRAGGGREREPLDGVVLLQQDDETDIEALSKALDQLQEEDPTRAALVKLRYFVGLTIPQAAEMLGISHATAERYWAYSRVRLFEMIQDLES